MKRRPPSTPEGGVNEMTRITTKGKSGARQRRVADDIDLERIVWDPEYRASVRDRLNRAAPPRRRAGRKTR